MSQAAEVFNLTDRTIFALLAKHLFGIPFTPENGVEWDEVFCESRNQAVTFQVFSGIHPITGIPEALNSKIKLLLLRIALKTAQVHGQHSYLHQLMTKHGISYVTLKGAASARYYPDPQSRIMGDVDFYVDAADFEKALAIFREEGFEVGDRNHVCHVVLKKGSIHMEMHHMPAGVPDGAIGQIVRGYLSDLREQAFLLDNKAVTCFCPSDFHHGLIMLMHMQHHILAEGIGLRHLCDWAVFVNHFREEAFTELFQEKLKAIGLWRLARLLSLCAVQYLGLPKQSWMEEKKDDLKIASSLMQDILSGGNFGKKDSQRSYEGLFISNRGKNGVRNSRIRNGIQAMNRITYVKFPWIKKCPILLPFGWILAFMGFLIRTRRRNKNGQNIHSLSAYQKSAPRIRLYQRLGIYEPEQ